MTEKVGIIAVKGGVVAKPADFAHGHWLFTLGDHLLRCEQTLVHNVLLRCLSQLAFEKTEEIAFTYKKVLCDLINAVNGEEVFVYILQSFGYKWGRCYCLIPMVLWKDAEIIEEFSQHRGDEGKKFLVRTALVIEIEPAKNVGCGFII